MVKTTALLGLCAAVLLGSPAGAAPEHPHPVAGTGKTRAGIFEAGRDGSTWALPGGIQVRLAAGSSMRMFQQPQLLQLAPGRRTRTYTVLLLSGAAYVDTGTSDAAVLVTTRDKLSVIVRGGHAALATQSHERAVLNRNAQVLLAVGGGAYSDLAKGQAITVDAAGSVQTRKRPAPPTFQPGPRVWVANSGLATLRGVTWSAGAARYRVVLRKPNITTAPVTTVTREPKLPATAVPPGRYELRVTPLDAMGLPGKSSAAVHLHVVQPVVPAGSFLDARGIVRLGRGQGLTFAGSDGLSVSYGSDGRFRTLRDAVRLTDERPITVYFHAPGSLNLTKTRVEPRGIVARIDFSPKNATWPAQPLHIRVQLASRRGEEVPAWITPKVRVLVGVEPVALGFTREGDQLVATLPAADSPGPWVIRVEVEDQYGIALGRNFTEVVEQRVAVSRR